ncbi:MAG: hypothetical protein D6B27_02955 [Gammaproteobacteria bacterium]|nr:MAG: hypothetical protein D6B27_02955 [Gammaproteobacteria bacterium]
MDDYNDPFNNSRELSSGVQIKDIMGVFLIICGVICITMILWIIYQLFTNASSIDLIASLSKLNIEERTIIVDQHELMRIPKGIMMIMGYVVFSFVLLVAASITKIVINLGVGLVSKKENKN